MIQGFDSNLVVKLLNIAALIVSCRVFQRDTYPGSLVFDKNFQFPTDYDQYLKTSVCLPGLISNDPIVTQMMDLETQVIERLERKILEKGKFIYQCSKDCLWFFYFMDCDAPRDRSRFPLCQKKIGAEEHEVLLVHDSPQIQMTIKEYIQKSKQINRFGYHYITTTAQSNSNEKGRISFCITHKIPVMMKLNSHDLVSSPV